MGFHSLKYGTVYRYFKGIVKESLNQKLTTEDLRLYFTDYG